jgi:hypothetical protein
MHRTLSLDIGVMIAGSGTSHTQTFSFSHLQVLLSYFLRALRVADGALHSGVNSRQR